jgi:hypothetical protein
MKNLTVLFLFFLHTQCALCIADCWFDVLPRCSDENAVIVRGLIKNCWPPTAFNNRTISSPNEVLFSRINTQSEEELKWWKFTLGALKLAVTETVCSQCGSFAPSINTRSNRMMSSRPLLIWMETECHGNRNNSLFSSNYTWQYLTPMRPISRSFLSNYLRLLTQRQEAKETVFRSFPCIGRAIREVANMPIWLKIENQLAAINALDLIANDTKSSVSNLVHLNLLLDFNWNLHHVHVNTTVVYKSNDTTTITTATTTTTTNTSTEVVPDSENIKPSNLPTLYYDNYNKSDNNNSVVSAAPTPNSPTAGDCTEINTNTHKHSYAKEKCDTLLSVSTLSCYEPYVRVCDPTYDSQFICSCKIHNDFKLTE